jgi:flagellar motor protein MotB
MRGLIRRRTQEEEEESVFVTMTDMTISFLLIVMILLAFFATQLSSRDTVPREQFNIVLNDLRTARAEIRRLEAERDAVIAERDRLRAENADLLKRIQELQDLTNRLQQDLDAVTAERDASRNERDAAIAERNAAIDERDRLRAENVDLLARIRQLEALVDRLQRDLAAVTAERDELIDRLSQLQQINPLEAYLAQAIEQRREILIELRERLLVQFSELEGIISIQQDTLRFQGEGLFATGQSQPDTERKRAIIETMGLVLDEILACYSVTETQEDTSSCGNNSVLVEAVQIEGHTDSVGTDGTNFPLSAARAITTLQTMVRVAPSLLTRLNWSRQPVMSIAGYGPMRPIDTNETAAGRSANRRIDLRIIMYAPSTVEEVEEIRRRLDALRAAGGSE